MELMDSPLMALKPCVLWTANEADGLAPSLMFSEFLE